MPVIESQFSSNIINNSFSYYSTRRLEYMEYKIINAAQYIIKKAFFMVLWLEFGTFFSEFKLNTW